MVTGPLLPEILHSCHDPAHTTSPQQRLPPARRKGLLLPLHLSAQVRGDAGSAASGGGPGCWCVRVARSGSSRGGRLEVRGGSGF